MLDLLARQLPVCIAGADAITPKQEQVGHKSENKLWVMPLSGLICSTGTATTVGQGANAGS